MAKYTSVIETDQDYNVLIKMERTQPHYVVTTSQFRDGPRWVFNTYKSARRAFQIFRSVDAEFRDYRCFYLTPGGMYWVNGNGKPLK